VSDIKLPLAFSVAGHTLFLALLLLLPSRAPPAPAHLAMGGIEVMFERAPEPPVATETAPPPTETPPPEPEPEPPPPPPPPVAAIEPPPPVPEAPVPTPEPMPPPPRKAAVKRPPKPAARHPETPPPNPILAAPSPSPPAIATAPQTAAAATPVPAPVPSPEVTQGYRALLSAWLNSHKRYPETARQRGEEGRAVLHFAVDHSGRVVDYAVAQSTGYADLDTAIEEMMRGAMMPPFPAGMTQPRIEVSVTIRFSLAR
jgi:protein TonB